MDLGSPDVFPSDSDLDSEEFSDAESQHSDTLYPCKRVHTLASCSSLSTPLVAGRAARSKAPASFPQYQHPGPDLETQQREKELAALRADKHFQRMRGRKRELMVSLASACGLRLTPEVLQTLETEYSKYDSSSITRKSLFSKKLSTISVSRTESCGGI